MAFGGGGAGDELPGPGVAARIGGPTAGDEVPDAAGAAKTCGRTAGDEFPDAAGAAKTCGCNAGTLADCRASERGKALRRRPSCTAFHTPRPRAAPEAHMAIRIP